MSLFGPGFGESIVLHLGDGAWIIVDSCIQSGTDEPAPLAYLRQLAVDPATAVRQVIATHWHDDHIRGLGRVVSACKSAEFVCSAALRGPDFFTLVEAYGQRTMMATTSGVQEFWEVIRALRGRDQQWSLNVPKLAAADRCLWQSEDSAIYSLSPSDASILLAHSQIAALLPNERAGKLRLPSLTANHAAVALWVKVGDAFILLGSDLEETRQPGTGWSVILGANTHPQGKATVFKIPHHGSRTSDQPLVWEEMVHIDPFAILTPFRNGNVSLPTAEDVIRICDRTERAYITAVPRSRRKRNRPSAVERTIRETVGTIREVFTSTGHVRLRANVVNQPISWSVELFGDAVPLRQYVA